MELPVEQILTQLGFAGAILILWWFDRKDMHKKDADDAKERQQREDADRKEHREEAELKPVRSNEPSEISYRRRYQEP